MAKATARKEFSPIRTGVDPRKDGKGGADGEGGGNNWLKIPPGGQADVTILAEAEELIVVEQCAIWMDDGSSPVWVYTGPDDPSHELNVKRTYRAYLPVLTEEGDSKIWSMSKTAHMAVLDIADASGQLKGMEVRIKRTGAGLATRYSVVPKGRRRDVSRIPELDIIPLLGPITPNEVREHIAKKLGIGDYEDVLIAYRAKDGKPLGDKPAPIGKKLKRAEAPVIEDEEEEDDDLDDLELK